jgi:chemotaxis protein MotB
MRTFASVALALAVAGCVSSGTYKKKEAEAEKYRQDWQDETAKRAALQDKTTTLQEKIASMQQQLEAVIVDVNGLRDKVRSDEGTLTQKEAELRFTRERLNDTQALVDELSKSKRKLEAAKAELERKTGEYEQLEHALRGEIEAGRIELTELRGRTTVKVKDKILFASGSATIAAEGRDALRKVAQALRGVQGKAIRVEGHTDNVPTNASGPFPTNWELSSARALAVVRFLQDVGLDPTRLSAAGFGEFQPLHANDTPEGRSLNRRIEIVLAPIEGAAPAPAPANATAGKR